MSCDAMFLSPHPDDVELFCGGTVAHLTRHGARVMICDLTRGELASNGTPEARRAASLRAAKILGVDDRPVLDLPDGGLDATADDQVRALVELIRRERPRWLVAPWPHDRHPDHVAAGVLARRVHFLAGIARYSPDAGEAFRSERLIFYPCHRDVDVSVVVDVSETIDAWADAVAAYDDQFRAGSGRADTPINRPGFLEGERGRRARWGQRIGATYGEGFLLEDPWPVSFAQSLGLPPREGDA